MSRRARRWELARELKHADAYSAPEDADDPVHDLEVLDSKAGDPAENFTHGQTAPHHRPEPQVPEPATAAHVPG